ncbi:TPA: hypothetical protein DCR49_01215 [Candidatus Delongbacteria bacterium]|nr:hypothetical protein [Candidatus Delongbacteria bacterium]
MNRTLLILLISCLTGLWASGSADYSDRENEITADSAFIKNLSDSIRSDYVKDEIKALLDKISGSKKIFRRFGIDVYKRQKFKYVMSYKTEMTISDLLDSLSDVIGKAKILRVNKLDLDNGNGNGKKISFSDNSFKDLEKEPSYKSKAKILDLIEKTALTSFQKSSLEWIWGKSPESDAYFSTKLTFFDDHFSLYPEYRFFVGNDPFRDPKSWFFALEDYIAPGAPLLVVAEVKTEEMKEDVIKPEEIKTEPVAKAPVPETKEPGSVQKEEVDEVVISQHAKPEEIPIASEPEFDCGGSDEISDFTLDAVFYEKNDKNELQPVNRTVRSDDMLKELFKNGAEIKFIRLTGSDYMFEGNEVRKSSSETVIEVAGDIYVCLNRLKAYLSEGISEPNKKRSIELITTANKDKLSYNAHILTVYDGQTTVFTEYKVYASSEVRKDKNSWFNKL